MKEYKPSILYGILAMVSVTAGPLFLVIRGSDVTQIEKLIYVVSVFPLGLLAMQVRHWERQREVLTEGNSEDLERDLKNLNREHRQILLWGVIGAVVSMSLTAWILFVWMPTKP